jgi:hypothetical protein
MLCSPYWHKIYKEDAFKKMSQYFGRSMLQKKLRFESSSQQIIKELIARLD